MVYHHQIFTIRRNVAVSNIRVILFTIRTSSGSDMSGFLEAGKASFADGTKVSIVIRITKYYLD
jgi:hypothetical protein